MMFFIIHFLLDMFVDLSRHAKPHVYCLHMLIIFAQALMDDLNSRENWNIQDWMYYAQHTDKSAESRLTIVALIFLNLDVFSHYFKSRKSVSPGKDIDFCDTYIVRTFKYLVYRFFFIVIK